MTGDLTWVITVGVKSGKINAPDAIEAATRFLEKLRRNKKDFGIGLLIKAVPLGKTDDNAFYLRSDILLANAGMFYEAEQMLALYLKKKPWPAGD